MNKYLTMIAAVAVLLCLNSCDKEHKNQEYVEETYVKIFKPQSIEARGIGEEGVAVLTVPEAYDKDFELDSRSFYSGLDTSLVFKGWRYKITNSNREMQEWCAIDYRITKINVVTLVDFDASHPAGSSLNDILKASYEYKHEFVSKKLSEISYGSLMLMDYFPYATDLSLLQIQPDVANDVVPPALKSYEVIIETAYGDKYSLKYP